MPISKDNTKQFRRMVTEQVARGLLAAAQKGADLYKADLSKVTHPEYPSGPFSDENTSGPGEFPYRRTGQAEENVAAEQSKNRLHAGFGVYGKKHGTQKAPNKHSGGLHVYWLWKNQKRLGPPNTYRRNKSRLATSFVKAAK